MKKILLILSILSACWWPGAARAQFATNAIQPVPMTNAWGTNALAWKTNSTPFVTNAIAAIAVQPPWVMAPAFGSVTAYGPFNGNTTNSGFYLGQVGFNYPASVSNGWLLVQARLATNSVPDCSVLFPITNGLTWAQLTLVSTNFATPMYDWQADGAGDWIWFRIAYTNNGMTGPFSPELPWNSPQWQPPQAP